MEKFGISNVPNLRFPEFEGKWEEKTIEKIAPLQRGFDLPTQNLKTGVIPIVYSNGILNHHSESKCKAPGLITGRSGTIGKFTFIETGEYWPHNTSLWVTDFCNNFPLFIYYFYQSIKIEQFATGSGVPTLNRNDVHRKICYIPTIAEQKKIAVLLQSIDDRISTQMKIIEKMESLIKGLVQSFVSGNKTGWKKQYLRNILKERNELNDKSYPIYSVAVNKGVVNQIEHLGRSFAAKDTSNYNVVRYGDVIYTKSPTGSFPYGIVKQSFIEYPVAVSPLYGVYVPINIHLGNILHHFFNSPINANNYLHSLIQKGAKNTINITNQRFLDKELFLPTDTKEIERIHFLLSEIQGKIDLEKLILKKYTEQKKYLLSNMFV
jgi:type I restriction enzyme S subunit